MTISKKVLLSMSVAVMVILMLGSQVAAESKRTGTVTGSVVNVRKTPNLSSKILDQLVRGTKVSVVESQENWHKVVFSDVSGWMHSDYLVVRDEKIADGVVSGSVVNVRSKSNTSSEVLTKFEKGTKVDIYESSGVWYRVSIGEERYGWMHGDYITVKKDKVSTATAKEEPKETQEAPRAADAFPVELGDVEAEGVEAGDVKEDVIDEAADEAGEASEVADDIDIAETDRSADLADRGGEERPKNPVNEQTNKEAALRKDIVEYAKTLIGIKYVYGGSTTKGFDCSGFVKYVYNHFDIDITRTSSSQSKGGKKVTKADMQPGDLVFFDTNGGLNNVTHVGIYIGDGKFIHASTYLKKAITIESMSSSYYIKRYMKSRDYISK